jgi:hypothetical protein
MGNKNSDTNTIFGQFDLIYIIMSYPLCKGSFILQTMCADDQPWPMSVRVGSVDVFK